MDPHRNASKGGKAVGAREGHRVTAQTWGIVLATASTNRLPQDEVRTQATGSRSTPAVIAGGGGNLGGDAGESSAAGDAAAAGEPLGVPSTTGDATTAKSPAGALVAGAGHLALDCHLPLTTDAGPLSAGRIHGRCRPHLGLADSGSDPIRRLTT